MAIVLSILFLVVSVVAMLALSVVMAQRWAIQDLTEEVRMRIRNGENIDELKY